MWRSLSRLRRPAALGANRRGEFSRSVARAASVPPAVEAIAARGWRIFVIALGAEAEQASGALTRVVAPAGGAVFYAADAGALQKAFQEASVQALGYLEATGLTSQEGVLVPPESRRMAFLGRFAPVEKALKELVLKAGGPEKARAHIGLGILRENRGDSKGALEEYQAALAADPDSAEVKIALALSLGVAPSDRHDDVWPVALQRSGVPEVRRQPGIRLLADRARVEHDDVGTVLRGRLAEPKRLEHPLDPLGIVSVHLTAERGDVVAPHG